MAERVGFEPTVRFRTPVFKTGAINHSTTSPDAGLSAWKVSLEGDDEKQIPA
jgi:hypothetical protein